MTAVSPGLRASLLSAYEPCPGFGGPCDSMRWQPEHGHVPRGFCGAMGDLREVKVVLVCAEPGDPHPVESHDARTPQRAFDSCYTYAYRCFEYGKDEFHRNVRLILDLCFPNLPFEKQMRLCWITNAVLCSAAVECGRVPARVVHECRRRYLMPSLDLMPDALVVALGSKAQERLVVTGRRIIPASHPSPPGCRFPRARPSWEALADEVRERESA